jgi:chromosome segregation ATPase
MEQTSEESPYKKKYLELNKDHQRLAKEMKAMSDTLSSLVKNNFNDFASLKEQSEKSIGTLALMYENNIKILDEKYQVYKANNEHKYKELVNAQKKINQINETNVNLTLGKLEHHTKELQEELLRANDQIKILRKELWDLKELCDQTRLTANSFQLKNELLENQIKELNFLQEKINNYIAKSEELNEENRTLHHELDTMRGSLKYHEERTQTLERDRNSFKISYDDIKSKYTTQINELVNKQNLLDEKSFELISLSERMGEFKGKLSIAENSCAQLRSEIYEKSELIQELKMKISQLELLLDEAKREGVLKLDKINFLTSRELELDLALKDCQNGVSDKIKKIHEEFLEEKRVLIESYERELIKTKDDGKSELSKIQEKMQTQVFEKDSLIKGLSSQVESYVEHQHLTIKENHKLRAENEILRSEREQFDKKLHQMKIDCVSKWDEEKKLMEREKKEGRELLEQEIRRLQLMNDSILEKHKQNIDALALSKETLTKMNEKINQDLRELNAKNKEIQELRETHTKQFDEINVLRTKIDKATSLINSMSERENLKDNKIREMHQKYQNLLVVVQQKSGMSLFNE